MTPHERLAATLRRAQRLPMYAGRLDGVDPDRTAPEDLARLPFLTREHLADAARDREGVGGAAALVHATPSPGGWTAQFLSRFDLEAQAEGTAELFRRVGVGPGSRVLVAFSYHLFAGGWLFHDGLVRAGAGVLPHGPGEAERAAVLARDFGCDVLVSNPSFALRVAEAGGRFRLLVASGEPFASVPGYRERVERATGGRAIDAYGMSETGLVAAETLDGPGLVPLEGMAVLEVVDPSTGEPTPDGERGELVVTSLAREVLPLVRFRTGDLTMPERSSGRLRLPRGVFGRTDDMVKVKGVKLYPREFGPILAAFPGLDSRHYQVLVGRKASGTDRLSLRIKAEPGASADGLLERVRSATGLSLDDVELVESTPGPLVMDERT